MRARTFAALVIGFVAGIVCAAAALWFTIGLNVPQSWAAWRTAVRALASAPQTATAPTSGSVPQPTATAALKPPVDNSLPDLSTAPKQPPLVPAPSDLPQTVRDQSAATHPQTGPATVPSQGEAERSIPEADTDHPIVPIKGLPANKIKDTFYDNRDGHEHDALDIPASRGTPVLAAVEGNVTKLFHSQQGGNTVYQFDDSGKFCYYYAHLDRYASGLKEGTLLRQGQVLGYVGTTGNAPPAAPHLHFAIFRLGPEKSWWKGTAIDPLPLLH